MLYDHTISESCFNVLCYMVLPGASAPWQNDVNRVPTSTKQHKIIPDLKVLCYMVILWMDLHTYILTIRTSAGSNTNNATWQREHK